MHGPLREKHPAIVPLLVDPLVPDREPGTIGVAPSQRGGVAPVRDGDVAVHLGLGRIEMPLRYSIS